MPIVPILPAPHACANPYLSPVLSYAQLDLSNNRLGPEGASALAPAIAVRPSLTKLDVSYNSMKGEGVKVIRDAVRGREGFSLIDHGND